VHHHVTCAASTGPAYDAYGGSSPLLVSGLASGVAYRCWARTVTNLATSAWSAASNWATPANGLPQTPAMGSAVAGPAQATVNFTPGSLNGGTLTHHHATCTAASGPAYNAYGSASPLVVAGLTSGVAYRCWVRTVTSLGTGAWSGASNWATPTNGPPAAPAIGTATAGPAEATVSFTPGSLNGGVLTHHHATCAAASGPSYSAYGSASPLVVKGLTSGTPYRCWVRTVSSLGTGAWSGATNWATPTNGPPAAPSMGGATVGAAQLVINFTPGSLNGGTLTHHHVSCTAASGPAYAGYGTASPIVVAGLTSGTPYRCWVRTVSNLGTGAWSGVSNWATPTNGPPAAPTMGSVLPGNTQLTVGFLPGSLNGGTLVHHHVACSDAGGTGFNGYGAAAPIVVAGLSNGTPYRCWARTVSNLGAGAWSGVSPWVAPAP